MVFFLKMTNEIPFNIIAWEEGEPAQTLLAPEQPMTNVVSSHQGQVFFLTEDGRVYLSTLKQESSGLSGKLQELALPCQCVVSIACNLTHIIFVTDRGRVLRAELCLPEKLEELPVKPKISCPHGINEEGDRVIVREVSSYYKHIFFISDSGKVWMVDENKSHYPELLLIFKSKLPISISCGQNFSAALIQEYTEACKYYFADQQKKYLYNTEASHDRAAPSKSVFVASCPDCRAQISIHSKEEHVDGKEEPISRESNEKQDSNTLAQVCWSKADHLVRQSALLLNSETAKQFLTRQLSWVTGSSELNDASKDPFPNKDGACSNPVTSRVVEGVRNIGDAVNRISRHWSTSSQEENPILPPFDRPQQGESFETTSLSNWLEETPQSNSTQPRFLRNVFEGHRRWKRHGTSSLSLDSAPRNGLLNATGPSPSGGQSDSQSESQPDQIIFAGQCLLNTSVWTWGNGSLGQLGQSDCVSRDQPTSIRCLYGIGVYKLVVGSFHCLALSLDGRVFAWGSNCKGQIGPSDDLTFDSIPREIKMPFQTTVKDIAAGGEHSLLLTVSGQVFFLGLSLATQQCSMMQLNLPIHSPHDSFVCGRVWASGSLSACYSTSRHSSCCSSLWTDLLVSEQLFLRRCFSVDHKVLDVLLSSAASAASPPPVHRQALIAQFHHLISCTAYHVHTLLHAQCSGQSVSIIRWMDEYIRLYRTYSNMLCSALLVNGLALNKNESMQLEKVWPLFVSEVKTTKTPFERVMIEPVSRFKEYVIHLNKLVASHADRKDCHHLASAAQSYRDASSTMESEYHRAEMTRSFWDSCSAKIVGRYLVLFIICIYVLMHCI